jgi:hypothetical protein
MRLARTGSPEGPRHDDVAYGTSSAASPGQLALVSMLQFEENASDRATANTVRTGIDWQYAPGLDARGFDPSALSGRPVGCRYIIRSGHGLDR